MESHKAYYQLAPINEKGSGSRQASRSKVGSVESSNVVPTECAETTEKSSVSMMNAMTKMTAMRAVQVNQASVYNASDNGKMTFSYCSSQKDQSK